MRLKTNVGKFTRITTLRSDKRYDLGQQKSSTITVVILQTPKVFACDTFMSKFRKSKRKMSLCLGANTPKHTTLD
jgi:hypothetical protein